MSVLIFVWSQSWSIVTCLLEYRVELCPVPCHHSFFGFIGILEPVGSSQQGTQISLKTWVIECLLKWLQFFSSFHFWISPPGSIFDLGFPPGFSYQRHIRGPKACQVDVRPWKAVCIPSLDPFQPMNINMGQPALGEISYRTWFSKNHPWADQISL